MEKQQIKNLKKQQQKAKTVIKFLIKQYGKNIPVYLHYHKNKPYEFLFAVMLSAQCKDERVNIVTKNLFNDFCTLESIANANIKTIEKYIKTLGLYHMKSRNLILCAGELINKYNGEVPNEFDKLIMLPGVGRKTANVVIGNLFKKSAIAVDTHVKRISKKLFDLETNNVVQIEEMLMKIIEKKYWVLWNTHIIAFGREICKAKNPKCLTCPIQNICGKKKLKNNFEF